MWFNVSCLVHGHDDRIRHAVRRMYLECAACGRETPGWDLARRAARSSVPLRHQPAGFISAWKMPVDRASSVASGGTD
jgi:hypothetical protein